jgi:hypothetical protein
MGSITRMIDELGSADCYNIHGARKGGTTVEFPIRFPSDAEVIDEEVARFRKLSAEERVLVLDEMFDLYHFLAERSAKPEALARFAREDEELSRAAVEEFVRRHG